jgi:hypothetical protein
MNTRFLTLLSVILSAGLLHAQNTATTKAKAGSAAQVDNSNVLANVASSAAASVKVNIPSPSSPLPHSVRMHTPVGCT